eukprot:scaffold134820_cov57-Cyclotella_meneghiniana.AAC.7
MGLLVLCLLFGALGDDNDFAPHLAGIRSSYRQTHMNLEISCHSDCYVDCSVAMLGRHMNLLDISCHSGCKETSTAQLPCSPFRNVELIIICRQNVSLIISDETIKPKTILLHTMKIWNITAIIAFFGSSVTAESGSIRSVRNAGDEREFAHASNFIRDHDEEGNDWRWSKPWDKPKNDEKKADGERCWNDDSCESGLCISFECAAGKLANGERCWNDDSCESGLCISFECAAGKLDNGEKCFSDDHCKSGECFLFKCAEEGTEGEKENGEYCIKDANCKSDICIDFKCKGEDEKKEVDKVCMEDDDCASGHCINFVCKDEKLADGKICAFDNDCESGNCTFFKCKAGKVDNGKFSFETRQKEEDKGKGNETMTGPTVPDNDGLTMIS